MSKGYINYGLNDRSVEAMVRRREEGATYREIARAFNLKYPHYAWKVIRNYQILQMKSTHDANIQASDVNLSYPVLLRNDRTARLFLPFYLREEDAEQICAFVRALVFPDDEIPKPDNKQR